MDRGWNRRAFLKRMGIAAAGIAGCSTLGLALRDQGRNEPVAVGKPHQVRDFSKGLDQSESLLAIGRGDPVQATRAAVQALGGMSRFVRPGETVAIKPNVGWDRAPIHAANTNPIVVAELVRLCREARASRVVITDSTCNEARRCFTRSGIWKAAADAGAEVILPAAHRFLVYDLGGVILGNMPVLVPAVSADRFINVPVAKHHGLTGYSGAMKNLYGVLGGRRNRLHQGIHDSIADLADFLRPTLTVMDATRVLLRNGPQGGNVADTLAVGEVIASTDQVAVDAYACGHLGLEPKDLLHLELAEKRGLGTADLSKIERREG